ncbi:MAG: hypothetical protein ABI967_16960 [bacterium]
MSTAKPIADRETRIANNNETSDKASGMFEVDWKRLGIYGAVAIVVFLLGLIPMWLKASAAVSQRDAAQHELQLSQLQNALSGAAIDARRGEYEPARQMASDFFTTLRTQIDNYTDTSAITPMQRDRARPLLAKRDEIITLLARSDPAAADRLSDLYFSYLQAMSGSQI